VHSRVRRVIFSAPDAAYGVLGSRTLLQELPGLNHRFEVCDGFLLLPIICEVPVNVDRCTKPNRQQNDGKKTVNPCHCFYVFPPPQTLNHLL
jgi:hypothetical protein